MQMNLSGIPRLKSIRDFFFTYGMGEPLHDDIMCMRLEDQPDSKLMHMPIYRSGFFRVILFRVAPIEFNAGENKIIPPENSLCFTYPGKLESWTRRGKLYGYVLYFSPAFLLSEKRNKPIEEEYPFFQFYTEWFLPLQQEESGILINSLEEMTGEIYSNHEDKIELMRKMLPVFLHRIKRLYEKHSSALEPNVKKTADLYQRFRKSLEGYMSDLINEKENRMPAVSILAEKLNVHPNYLNSQVKAHSGIPASEHIRQKLLLESKALLLHTQLRVTEIAVLLGFQHDSYFNRLFKSGTGHTPSGFRQLFVQKNNL